MSTPYVFLAAQKKTEKIETPQDTFNLYFWGGVITMLVLTGVALLVMYGLQTAKDTEDVPSHTFTGGAAPILTQLPLYLGSTQFSDPPENV
jgi:hypothetical protein